MLLGQIHQAEVRSEGADDDGRALQRQAREQRGELGGGFVLAVRFTPSLDGELRFDDAVRNGGADDFGHIVHKMPEGVLLPGSADDVAKIIQWAAQRGIVATRPAGR